MPERKKQHGMYKTKTYKTWEAMKRRCLNESCEKYKSYGERGIKVCDKWLDFRGFYEDMGDKPEGYTLDRINVDGDYCKENCRWVTQKEQQNNRTNNRIITIGSESKNVTQWAEISGIRAMTIFMRLERGWSERESIFAPLGTRKKQAIEIIEQCEAELPRNQYCELIAVPVVEGER